MGQKFSFSLGINGGTYSMQYLKFYQSQFAEYAAGVPLKITDSFPARLGAEGNLSINIKRFQVGVFIWRNSTGGRVHYEDYSGYLLQDMVATTTGLGIRLAVTINPKSKYKFYVVSTLGNGWNSLALKEELKTGNPSDYLKQNTYSSSSILSSGGIGIRTSVYSKFSLALEPRYEFSVKNNDLQQSSGGFLTDFYGYRSHPNWDGMRISLSIGYDF